MNLETITTIAQASPAVIFAIVIYAAVKKWWVPGWLYSQTLAERDEWKRIALAALDEARETSATARKATDVAAVAVTRGSGQ